MFLPASGIASLSGYKCARNLPQTVSPVLARFRALKRGEGWNSFPFRFERLRNPFENRVFAKNMHVALLVRDGRSPGGVRLVDGYIQSITEREDGVIRPEELTRAEKNQLLSYPGGELYDSYPLYAHALILSSEPPETYDFSVKGVKYPIWRRDQKFIKIRAQNIVSVAYESNPF